jgi:mono/diheme cytochrome c family protein
MTLADQTRALFGAAVAFTWLTIAASSIAGHPQAPAGSDGWQIPEGAATETSPEPPTAAMLAKGQSLYKSRCQRCHGADGAGRGPDADPTHPAGNLTDPHLAARNPDGVVFYKIWNGRAKPKMPATKTDLSRTDVWMLVQYVKTLRRQVSDVSASK